MGANAGELKLARTIWGLHGGERLTGRAETSGGGRAEDTWAGASPCMPWAGPRNPDAVHAGTVRGLTSLAAGISTAKLVRVLEHFHPDCAGRKCSTSLFDRMIHAL
jgi:hypothetical protein